MTPIAVTPRSCSSQYCFNDKIISSSPFVLVNMRAGPSAIVLNKIRRPPLFCSCRLVISLVSCLGFICMYSVRLSIFVAMPCMVYPSPEYETPGSGLTKRPLHCKGNDFPVMSNTSSNGEDTEEDDNRYKWDKSVQAAVIQAFFWSYWITQVPGALLSERYGGKIIFGCAIFASGVTTLLTPVAASLHYVALIIVRLLLGLVQGVIWPAMFVIWSRWAPPLERQKLMTLCFSGVPFGVVSTFPIVNAVCNIDEHAWSFAFYISGAATIMLCVLWNYYVYDTPDQHPRISKMERKYIYKSLKETMPSGAYNNGITRYPWKDIMTSPAVWVVIFSHLSSHFSIYSLLGFTRDFLHDVHYFSKSETATIAEILCISFYISSNVSAAAYDAAITRHLCSRTFARKVGNTLGFLVPGLLLIPLGFLECTHNFLAASTLVTIILFTGVQWGAGYTTNPADIDPQHAGLIFGISNTFASIFGSVSITMTKELTINRHRSGWQTNFLVISFVCVLASVMFIIFGSGEIQHWAKPSGERKYSISTTEVSALSATIKPLSDQSAPL